MKYIPANKLQAWRISNEPKQCPILGEGYNKYCVDHDHKDGMIRGVISSEANTLIGKIENIFYTMCRGKSENICDVLINIGEYLNKPNTNYLHPVGCKQLTSRFSRLKKDDQEFALHTFGYTKEEINACKNIKQRVKLYELFLKKEFYGKNKTKHKTKACLDTGKA